MAEEVKDWVIFRRVCNSDGEICGEIKVCEVWERTAELVDEMISRRNLHPGLRFFVDNCAIINPKMSASYQAEADLAAENKLYFKRELVKRAKRQNCRCQACGFEMRRTPYTRNYGYKGSNRFCSVDCAFMFAMREGVKPQNAGENNGE